MNSKRLTDGLFHHVPLRILSTLSLHSGKVHSAREISIAAKTSKGATHETVHLLLSLGILSREQKGNVYLYTVNSESPVLKQFKIFETVLSLQKLVDTVKGDCYQIILFGSCADGSNTIDSDIDIFIKTEYKDKVHKKVHAYKETDLEIKALIQEPLEIVSAMKKDKAFYDQVNKGIVLWEGKPDND